jgi:hypothetical protein
MVKAAALRALPFKNNLLFMVEKNLFIIDMGGKDMKNCNNRKKLFQNNLSFGFVCDG